MGARVVNRRESDLKLLGELVDQHPDELTDAETEAFASMRLDLTAYDGPQYHQLTDRQRAWVESVYRRVVPDYANLASRGLVPQGKPTAESKKLDAMLAAPKLTRPPPRKRGE